VTDTAVAQYAEPPEVERRIYSLGSILLAAATAFFFIAFLFAFLYLRALNSNGLWGAGKPHHHVHASLGLGIAILVCVLAGVAAARAALLRPAFWLPASGATLLFALAAIALQCWQWANLGFGPGDGGYASVYLGWTGFFTIFVLGAVYWLETIVAGAVRARVDAAEVAPQLAGFGLFWTVLGLVEIAAFVLLFGVK
jgi:heme/copper-type cytochrome/quinol oxidase subunit 3